MEQSLHHSCRTELTRRWISLPSDRQSYSRRLLELKLVGNTYSYSLWSTGQVSDFIHHNYILQSPVFLINSRHSLLYDTLYAKVLLIQMLQSQFAEFLQSYSSIALVYSTLSLVSDLIRCADQLSSSIKKRVLNKLLNHTADKSYIKLIVTKLLCLLPLFYF